MKYVKHTYTDPSGGGEAFTVTAPEGVRVPVRLAFRKERGEDPVIYLHAATEEAGD